MVEDFYAPCLRNAFFYDRAVGFFRSTVFLLVNEEIATFAIRGGKIRIICSPNLSENDIKALKDGYHLREQLVHLSIEKEIDELLCLHEISSRTVALATLISLGILDIKIAIKPDSFGMYHEKLGIFRDNSKAVSFKGSANETWNGWHQNGNYESIEVFCSWKQSGDSDRVSRHIEYFEKLWNNDIPKIQIYDFPAAAQAKLCKIAKDDIESIDWGSFKQKKKSISTRKPFEHQLKAIENWKANGNRGIFQHATGSGKTFTAITALREHTLSGMPVLILVPSKLLLRQWTKELKDEIPEAIILKAGDGNNSWKKANILKDFSINDNSLEPRIILSTMQTASSQNFIEKIVGGQHLMLVADEVHQTGSHENSKIFDINAGKRLGLSATPIRYGDPEGTQKMLSYFGGVVEPIFTLADAIKSGRLVEYEYHPYEVHLTADESEEWKELSNQISREIAKSPKDNNGKCQMSIRARMLLIKRSRIAKKAKAKIALAEKIFSTEYAEGDKWLVYCEDQYQLSIIFSKLKELGLHVNEYHTSMSSDMDATLEWFKTHGGILVSIRCLDEGVDIPDITHALILASSQNPRQFIQRRGRILRKAPEKLKAVLYDAIVIPIDLEKESEQTSLVKSEFCRAIEFAKGGINKSSSVHLKKVAIDLGLDIEELAKSGTEEEIAYD